jgi:hypothetical protein
MTMLRVFRATLYTIAALALLLGLWGILANLAMPLMPDYGKTGWNFFGPFEKWDASGPSAGHRHEIRIPWWAISFQTPCPYLDPYLAGPVGYGFYALCCTWGMGTILLLRSGLRSFAGRVFWPVFLFGAWWLIGLGGIVAHVMFFVSMARETHRAGLWP